MRLLVWTTCSIPTFSRTVSSCMVYAATFGLVWLSLAALYPVVVFHSFSLDYFYGSISRKTGRLASTVVQGHSLFSVMAQGQDDLLSRKVGWLKYHSATSVTRDLGSGFCTLRASLSGTFLQTLPDLVTPLKGHFLSPRSCPPTRSAPPPKSSGTNKFFMTVETT